MTLKKLALPQKRAEKKKLNYFFNLIKTLLYAKKGFNEMKCSKEEVYIVTSHINYVFVVCALEVFESIYVSKQGNKH